MRTTMQNDPTQITRINPIHTRSKIRIGLIGTGRLGSIYARIISGMLPNARLAAVAGAQAEEIGAMYSIDKSRRFNDRLELLECGDLDAIVIVSSTDTHVPIAIEAIQKGFPVLCEKPLGLDIGGARAVAQAVETHRTLFQMGFMRRWDPAYSTAKHHIENDEIGTPVVYKATGRDATRTAIQYAGESGGILFDMGVHDFDLARFFMGEVTAVTTYAGTLVYPELRDVPDYDNTITMLTFASGALGVVDLSRNAGYGAHNECEVLGSRGAVRMGKTQYNPVEVRNADGEFRDCIPTYAQRFFDAFPIQLQDFVNNVISETAPSVTVIDGVESLRICEAAKRSADNGGAEVLLSNIE
jgi:scyllo-inositol 2-dehydrogenase (NAD+)